VDHRTSVEEERCVQCSGVQCSGVQCSGVQCSGVQCSRAQRREVRGRRVPDHGPVGPVVPEDPQTAAQRQAAALWEGDVASRSLGIEVTGVAPGRATATMTVLDSMVNGHGTCHGGYLFLLADTAFAFACNTRGPAVVASGADVTFLAPVRRGERLAATAVERVVRGRSGLYDVSVRRGDEVVLELRGRSRALLAATQSGPEPA
jgi:acyl-CoA thioesterase